MTATIIVGLAGTVVCLVFWAQRQAALNKLEKARGHIQKLTGLIKDSEEGRDDSEDRRDMLIARLKNRLSEAEKELDKRSRPGDERKLLNKLFGGGSSILVMFILSGCCHTPKPIIIVKRPIPCLESLPPKMPLVKFEGPEDGCPLVWESCLQQEDAAKLRKYIFAAQGYMGEVWALCGQHSLQNKGSSVIRGPGRSRQPSRDVEERPVEGRKVSGEGNELPR